MNSLTKLAPAGVRRTVRRWRRLAEPRVVVLMYHRVAELACDPWDLCVTPQHFDQQLDALKRQIDVIPIEEIHDALARGGIGFRAAVITFDDGYADNLHVAQPLLERHGLPAAFFLSTDALNQDREFWWDEVERIFLCAGRLPETLDLRVTGRRYSWSLKNEVNYTPSDWERHCRWRAYNPPDTQRQRVYYGVWNLLRSLPVAERDRLLVELAEWSDTIRTPRLTHRVMTRNEARQLVRAPGVELGAHGKSHVALSSQPVDEQIAEIRSSKSNIEDLVNGSVRYFAYPYGDHSAATASVVRDAGFSAAVSTREGIVHRRGSRWQWPRCKVHDWSREEFSRRLTHLFQIV